MKRILAGFLAITLLFSFTSCTNKPQQSTEFSSDTQVLNPFDGLVVEFDGISPFCTISFNNSRCSEDVQLNVEYSVDPEIVVTDRYFKINEKVTVYALLKNENEDEQEFSLSEYSKEYEVTNVPEYITEITEDMDLSQFKQEAQDYMESVIAFTDNQYLGAPWFAHSGYRFIGKTEPQKNDIYFSAMKLNAYGKHPNELNYFNKINITYSIGMMSDRDQTHQNRYFTIVAKNLVRYPDGRIAWGVNDPNDLSFEHNVDSNTMESLISSNITAIKADYNVTNITDILQ